MLFEQLGCSLWSRYFSNPAAEVALMITELESGVCGFPGLAVGDDGQVVYISDDQMLVEAAI